MATLTFELNDTNGTPVEVGDLIKVEFPPYEWVRHDSDGDIDDFGGREQITAICKVLMQPANGLKLSVKRILDNGDDTCDLYYNQQIKFIRTKYKFWILDESEEPLVVDIENNKGTFKKYYHEIDYSEDAPPF